MSDVTITIKIASLVSDLQVKSFMNTERIKDPSDRYATRAAEENKAELLQALQNAWRSMMSICRRFLSSSGAGAQSSEGDDTFTQSEFLSDMELVFNVTERRVPYLAELLPQIIHDYLVSATLRRFYTSAAASELATIYAADEKNAANELVNILYKKLEPVYSEE